MFVTLYRYFQNKKAILFILVALVCGLLFYRLSFLKPQEDIIQFFPSDKNTGNLFKAISDIRIKDKVIIDFSISDSTEEVSSLVKSEIEHLGQSFKSSLFSGLIEEVKYRADENVFPVLIDHIFQNLPIYLHDSDYVAAEAILSSDSFMHFQLEQSYKLLLSPAGSSFARIFSVDPIGLGSRALKRLESLKLDNSFDTDEGYFCSADRKHYVMVISPSFTTQESKLCERFSNLFYALTDSSVNRLPKSVFVFRYGAPLVAHANATQIKSDSLFTSGLAIAIIIVVLFFYFRRFWIPLVIIIPVIFGALFSLAVISFIQPEISLISIGTGAIILGVAINYSLHFFVHHLHSKSVETTIRELFLPMTIGCITTIAAFFSLKFASSKVLQDFGMFAGFSLIGALLISFILLPHFLGWIKQSSYLTTGENDSSFSIPELHRNKWVVGFVVVLTCFFLYKSFDVGFEEDMTGMSYQTNELKKSQLHFDSLNQFSYRKVFLVSSGNTFNSALENQWSALNQIHDLRNEKIISDINGVGPVLIPLSVQRERISKWNVFWNRNRSKVIQNLNSFARNFNLSDSAFGPFYQLLNAAPNPSDPDLVAAKFKFIVGEFVKKHDDSSYSVFSALTSTDAQKHKIYERFQNSSLTVPFDKASFTSAFVKLIRDDFNGILYITAGLIFLFMLLAHGRIELAILNFLPMAISWIWILGLMSLLGIKLNIINIIISTFIFGLGDDYSIFILDGLSKRYKYGTKQLDSFKSSILLSGVLTIIGIGVLIFAKHPALKSVSLVTVSGMIIVLFISFILQPLLYDFGVLNRNRKGFSPYTAFNFIYTYLGLLIFILASIFILCFAWVSKLFFGLFNRNFRFGVHVLISALMKFMLKFYFPVKKRFRNYYDEDFSRPAILVANHQSIVDLAMTLSLYPKIVVFVNDWVFDNPIVGPIQRLADNFKASDGYEKALPKLRELISDGYSVLIFPEGTRSVTGRMGRFHKGAFFLAEQLQLDIIPLVLHGVGQVCPKGDFYFNKGVMTLEILSRIKPDDNSFGNTYQLRAKEIRAFMQQRYDAIVLETETTNYFRPRLIANFIFKGPVLEWYTRIKTKLEANYDWFNKTLPVKGKITDLGCGYGYLPLMLYFCSDQREILGVDYDSEKITIAKNCRYNSKLLRFEIADVTQFPIPPSDGIIVNDVLHYLSYSDQDQLLQRCIKALQPGGILIIRDGDKSMERKHIGTRLTEWFSTGTGFNKTTTAGLAFTSAERILNILDHHQDVSWQKIDNTKFTSNIIFVIRKHV